MVRIREYRGLHLSAVGMKISMPMRAGTTIQCGEEGEDLEREETSLGGPVS